MRPLPREARKEETLRSAFYWLLIPSVFLVDRLVKTQVLQRLAESQSVPVWPGVFHLTRVNNTGAAFGLWRDASGVLAVFSAVSVVLILAYLAGILGGAGLPAGRQVSQGAAWALIAGGAIGNLYDRVLLGYVIDYLDFRVWPVFNLADACISAGVAWIVFRYASRSV